ncbi:MAG: glycerophosphodiester phosphodiesterase [Desulfobulbaceae bacterium A2]|nr:MAG: glycerophosphodiester phosphodiesterase [Desulfobulbaceae bacterium A2]
MLCFGHRGAAGHAPENTLLSIRTALTLGVDWVEIDVQQVEGELLVFHDERLERTTNGSGRLAEHDLAVLRRLDAGQGERIPLLAEVSGLIDGRVGLNIELKGPGTVAPTARHLEELRQQGWPAELLLVSSFNHRWLAELRACLAWLRLGALLVGLPLDDAACVEPLGAWSVHPCREFLDARFVDDAHQRGLQVIPFTVNDEDELRRMRQLGVDGVFSDYPELVSAGR